MTRIEAIHKLVDTFHLNNEERKALSDSPLRTEEVVSSISHILTQNRSYPTGWNSEENFDGVLLEIRENELVGTYKAEVGLMNFKILEQKVFSMPEAAARYAISKMFNGNIDGIELK